MVVVVVQGDAALLAPCDAVAVVAPAASLCRGGCLHHWPAPLKLSLSERVEQAVLLQLLMTAMDPVELAAGHLHSAAC